MIPMNKRPREPRKFPHLVGSAGVPAENPDEWGWHGPGMGLAWAWHGVGMGLAWGRMGLAWGRMGLAWAAWGRMGMNLQGPRCWN
jgi:hypothetical protein